MICPRRAWPGMHSIIQCVYRHIVSNGALYGIGSVYVCELEQVKAEELLEQRNDEAQLRCQPRVNSTAMCLHTLFLVYIFGGSDYMYSNPKMLLSNNFVIPLQH